MTLAGQTTRALSAVGERDTTLLLDVDGSLGARGFGLGLVLLFLLLCAFGCVFGLALLARGAVVLAGRLGTHGCVFFFGLAVGVVSFGSACGRVASVLGFLLLALLLLLLLNALLDVRLGFVP